MNMKPLPGDTPIDMQDLRDRANKALSEMVFGHRDVDLKAELARYRRAIEALKLPAPQKLLANMMRNATDFRRRP